MEILIGVAGLIVAVIAAYIGYLQFKQSNKSIANEEINQDFISQPCLVDIGKVNPPTDSIPNAEVRFSFANTTRSIVKITSISLNVLSFEPCRVIAHPKAAVPIDEYFLHARIKPIVEAHELLSHHHEVRDKSEGFFLKIEAIEGYTYTLSISVIWNFLSKEKKGVTTSDFKIDFPVQSPEEILRILENE